MTTRETFLLFTVFPLPFSPSFLSTSKIIQKIRKNVKTSVYYFQIVHCYLKIQLLKYTLDLNNDKNPGKIKIKEKKKKKRK